MGATLQWCSKCPVPSFASQLATLVGVVTRFVYFAVEWQKHEHPKGVARDQETMQSIRGTGGKGLVPSNKE